MFTKRYNKRRRKNVLTESTVLAVPVHVMEGTVSADESGVTVEQLQGVWRPSVLHVRCQCSGWFWEG